MSYYDSGEGQVRAMIITAERIYCITHDAESRYRDAERRRASETGSEIARLRAEVERLTRERDEALARADRDTGR